MRSKGGSFLFTRCHGDLAPVGGHDSFGNEKPEVEPGLLALDRILILTARHRVENGGDGVGGNSVLGMNGKDYFATRAFRRNVNRKGPRTVQIDPRLSPQRQSQRSSNRAGPRGRSGLTKPARRGRGPNPLQGRRTFRSRFSGRGALPELP